MKKVYTGLLIIVSAAILPAPSHAQLLKTLLSNAKKTISGNSSSGSTTGKKDSTAQGSTLDSAALMQKLAQLKSTSASAQSGPMGPSVSPADSAAAIQSFKTASGGSGQYYQYLETYTFANKKGRDSAFRDTMAIAFSDAHFVRTSFGVFGVRTAILGHPSMARYFVMLNANTRTYTLHVIDTAALSRGDGWTYHVVKVGSERVGNYDCTHARLTMSKPGIKEAISEDIWASTQIPGYATIKQLNTMRNVTPAAMKALEQAGCDGFVVKMTMHGAAYSMEMQLTEAGRKNFSAAEFEIPAGYSAQSLTNPYGHSFQQ